MPDHTPSPELATAAPLPVTADATAAPVAVSRRDRLVRNAVTAAMLGFGAFITQILIAATPAAAQAAPTAPSVNVNVGTGAQRPANVIIIILLLTVLSLAPSLLILMTGFTRIIIVLSLARNAMGMPTVPPNQVLVGLALFLTLFVMSPVFKQVNDTAIQPYLKGSIDQKQALEAAQVPIKDFMLKNTGASELALFQKASKQPAPAKPSDVSLIVLTPAFVLSEIRSAFIIGFVIFIPFLVIDLLVSSTLMSLGMMMLPPSMVSLPFKLLLFVLVDGWGLVVTSLIGSYR